MKERLRREILLKRSGQSPEAIAEKSKAVGERLVALPEWHKAATLMLYAATRSEVQTRALIEKALAQGKRVCLPVRSSEEEHEMSAYYVKSVDELVLGDLGYLEPRERSSKAEPLELAIHLVEAGQDQDRRADSRGSQTPQDLIAVNIRQHEVQQDDVVVVELANLQPVLSKIGRIADESL